MPTPPLDLLLYLSLILFIVGLTFRLWQLLSTPVVKNIPTMPAPTTGLGVFARLSKELLLFSTLFHANKTLWLLSWSFHFGLLWLLVGHLFLLFSWPWLLHIKAGNEIVATITLAALIALWLRRLLITRMRLISTPSDHLMLWLLMAIISSGLLSAEGITTHLLLVCLLLIIFPISKLMHAPGFFFSPTRNQQDGQRD